jgi:hypothetical protein
LPEPNLNGLLVGIDRILTFTLHTLDNPQIFCFGKRPRERISTFIIASELKIAMEHQDIDQEICPICLIQSMVTISLDRVLLLCECDACQKFIVKKNTLNNLRNRKDSEKNRKNLSDYIRDYYHSNKRALEIVIDGEAPVTKNFKSLGEIIKEIQLSR